MCYCSNCIPPELRLRYCPEDNFYNLLLKSNGFFFQFTILFVPPIRIFKNFFSRNRRTYMSDCLRESFQKIPLKSFSYSLGMKITRKRRNGNNIIFPIFYNFFNNLL